MLAESSQSNTYAYCSFYSNVNEPPTGRKAAGRTSFVPEDIEGSIEIYQNPGSNVSTVYVALTGLNSGESYSFTVNENNDITNRCRNIGSVFNPSNLSPPRGYIGKTTADGDGNVNTSFGNKALVISGPGMSSIVGRSCAIHKLDGTTKKSDAWSDDTVLDCSEIFTN